MWPKEWHGRPAPGWRNRKDGRDARATLSAKNFAPAKGTLERVLSGRARNASRSDAGGRIAAMERLWESEIDENWVIVGKLGWNMDDLAERMRRHKEYQHRLLWLGGVSDEMLDLLYRKSTALIAASECEGFGLPIIEAAQYGLPIIARDIPIFREVAGEHAFYFDGSSAEPLANALRTWLTLGNNVPKSDSIKPFTWQQSSQELVDIVMGRRPYLQWPAERHRGWAYRSATGKSHNSCQGRTHCDALGSRSS
jgi:Glycosyl transferases group 1